MDLCVSKVSLRDGSYNRLRHRAFHGKAVLGNEKPYGEIPQLSVMNLKISGKQAIMALNGVTTDRVINLLIVDGTKDELIFRALKKRLTESQVSFEVTELDRYNGIVYSR